MADNDKYKMSIVHILLLIFTLLCAFYFSCEIAKPLC